MAENTMEAPEPNSPTNPCYDCGSTIADHHTPSCDMTMDSDILDLPEQEGTQWWTREMPTS